MISDEAIEDRIAAILMDGGDLQSQGALLHRYKRSFGADETETGRVKSALYRMTKDDRLIEHDVEGDTIDGALIEHDEHGQLSTKDMTFLDLDELFAMGPEFMIFLRERSTFVAEQASIGGLTSAIGHMSRMPIDSSLWTGMPVGFKLDGPTKAQVIKLLHRANDEISQSTTNNREVSQARALIEAALILTEAPDPESELVWGILQKLSVFIALGQGIESILKLFKVI